MRTMTWSETHRRWAVLREVLETLEADPGGGLPWKEEYADLFGDPQGLVAALRYRWELTARAQYDPELPEDVLEAHWRELTARHAGLLRLLTRLERRRPHPRSREEGCERRGQWVVR